MPAFTPIPFEDTSIDEAWLQQTLFEHPELLPMSELDRAFGPIRPLAREVSTGVGSLDWLGISPGGFLTVVEMKLFRNPQSRREALGQILDYCARLALWSYDDLVEAVRNSRHCSNDHEDPVLFAAGGKNTPLSDQNRFRTSVAESMSHGRFMLMIVGDGFHESTVSLVGYIEKSMHLQFTIRLVELKLYRSDTSDNAPILVVPRVAARTKEVVRSIVRIQPNVKPSDFAIESVPAQITTPTVEEFLDALKPAERDRFAALLAELNDLDVHPDPTKDGVSLRWPDPGGSDQAFRIFRARRNGHIRFGVLVSQLERQGYNSAPAMRFVETVAAWMNDVVVRDTGAIVGHDGRSRDVPLALIVGDKHDDFLVAVKRLLDDIKADVSMATHA